MTVPELADWCAVDLLNSEAVLNRLIVVHADPAKARAGEELRDRLPDPRAVSGAYVVALTGQPRLVPVFTPEMIEKSVRNPEFRRLFNEIGIHSYMGVPLAAHGRILGVLTLFTAESRRTFDKDSLELAIELGRRCGIAVAIAQYYRANQASEDQYRRIFRHAPVGIAQVAPDGRILAANPRLCAILGQTEAETLARTPEQMSHPDDWREESIVIGELWTGAVPSYSLEKRLIRSDGLVVWVRVTSMLAKPIEEQSNYRINIFEDISELRAARQAYQQSSDTLRERNVALARSNLLLARSNDDLESFASVTAHDLKEPLRGINTQLEILVEDAADHLTSQEMQRIARVRSLARRMYDLLGALQRYASVGREGVRAVDTDLRSVVSDVVDALAVFIDERAGSVRIEGELPTLRCDPDLMNQVFSNLIVNGLKYNDSPHKTVTIGVAESPVEGGPVIYVSDNGIGIEPRHQRMIFRMFKRLHHRDAYGGGTGAGLAIVRRIIDRHGGRLWLTSEVGEGTTVYFTLGAEAAAG
jgi:PAS domain S-box-containing protein